VNLPEPLPVLVSPTMAEIREAVCRKYRISMMELLGQQRARYVARPRQIGMFLARRMTMRSLPEIGQHFGGRDHTTVIHACSTVMRLCAEDKEVAEDVLLLELALQTAAQNRTRLALVA
jgi:chromosomal replication initiator protein